MYWSFISVMSRSRAEAGRYPFSAASQEVKVEPLAASLVKSVTMIENLLLHPPACAVAASSQCEDLERELSINIALSPILKSVLRSSTNIQKHQSTTHSLLHLQTSQPQNVCLTHHLSRRLGRIAGLCQPRVWPLGSRLLLCHWVSFLLAQPFQSSQSLNVCNFKSCLDATSTWR